MAISRSSGILLTLVFRIWTSNVTMPSYWATPLPPLLMSSSAAPRYTHGRTSMDHRELWRTSTSGRRALG
uniref:Putative secreted protein n=1 Tax=Anopheles darlingi TaxID=43151 RepID=A0A2M4DFN9_ANODA